MHVVFVSLCQKSALKKTRAILDSYAIRISENSWATPITMQGLGEVRKLLKASATRQTAVACYRNKGVNRLELIWQVGSKAKFSESGQVAVGSKRRKKSPRAKWENEVNELVSIAGLCHDLGKYSEHFQNKLKSKSAPLKKDPIRHEWVSQLVVENLVNGMSWEDAWSNISDVKNPRQFKSGLNSMWDLLMYEISTHHRLPKESGHLSMSMEKNNHVSVEFTGQVPVPVSKPSNPTLATIRKKLLKIKNNSTKLTPGFVQGLALLTRVSLILADHSVSSEDCVGLKGHTDCDAYANTSRAHGGALNQSLEWHLTNVSDRGALFSRNITKLEEELPGLSHESSMSIDQKASGKYEWQETATRVIKLARQRTTGPIVVLNLAGTGAGKTRMNARAAVACSHSNKKIRFHNVQNLRTLTLQTGDAYLDQLNIQSEDMSCIIGDKIAQALHEYSKEEDNRPIIDADEDGNPVLPEYESSSSHDPELPLWLEPFFRDQPKLRTVLSAPVLVSTIDFIIEAGELHRQGAHALALLRVMTSDLILDEIDSYDPDAFVAVIRLVRLSAFFGRNIIASSATLSKELANHLFLAVNEGLQMRKDFFEDTSPAKLVMISDVAMPAVHDLTTLDSFSDDYSAYLSKMTKAPSKATKVPMLIDVDKALGKEGWVDAIKNSAEQLHANHALTDPKSGKKVSIGLVRVANIKHGIYTAIQLSTKLPNARVCCYHSQHFKIQRYFIEKNLDEILSRKDGDYLNHPEIRKVLDSEDCSGIENVLFIVVATPVEEIGRDHDFDWAIIEPSSAQSISQTAGRVNRHRQIEVKSPNVGILRLNYKEVSGKKIVFSKPGYESDDNKYVSHDMKELISWENFNKIDSRLRFGSHKISEYDDKNIKIALENARHYSNISGVMWMCEDTYTKYALRTKTPKEDWVYIPETGKYEVWDYNSGIKKLEPKETTNQVESKARRPNDWLALSISDMQELAEDAGIPSNEAFSFSITGKSTSDNKIWVNASFGIRRKDKN